MTIDAPAHDEFFKALAAAGRSPDIPDELDLYGWLVGSWKLDVRRYWGVDVSAAGLTGELHAGWVLEGRAVQDVWIMPGRPDRALTTEKTRNMYGTTLRVWDPTIQAWRIIWSNPAGDHHEQQIGRRSGSDIVQLGVRPNGTTTRWTFTDITPVSFHWLGDSLAIDGKTWTLEGEFLVERTG